MKGLLKHACYGVALAIVSPLAFAERLARRLLGRDVLFAAHGELLSLLPGKTGYFLRNAYWHLTLRRCPLDCCFQFGTLFTHSGTEVGERVYTGARCIVGLASIGDDTMLADHVQILSGGRQHGFADPGLRFQDQPGSRDRVRIGANCWIGSGAIVMAEVGDSCVIGAGSVVTKPIPAGSVAVGNPARAIRQSFSGSGRETLSLQEGRELLPARSEDR